MDEEQLAGIKRELENVTGFAADNGLSLTQIIQRLDRIIELLEDQGDSH